MADGVQYVDVLTEKSLVVSQSRFDNSINLGYLDGEIEVACPWYR